MTNEGQAKLRELWGKRMILLKPALKRYMMSGYGLD